MTTTKKYIERVANSVKHEVKKVDGSFENDPAGSTVEDGFSTAIAPELKLLEKEIEEASKQGCPLTATSKKDSSIGQAENWGNVKLGRDPNPAIPAEYTITINGTGTYYAGHQFTDDSTNFVFLLQSDVVSAGSAIGNIKSVGVGVEIVKTVGTILYSQSKVDDLSEEVVIESVVTSPVEAETTAEYIDEVIKSFSNTPRGGAIGDYRVWGLTVAGTKRIFPYNRPASGVVYIQADINDSNEYGIPTQTIIDLVEAVFDANDPMNTGELQTKAVIQNPYETEVLGLSDSTKQALILPKLKEYFVKKFPFIDTLDNENLRTDLVLKSDIYKIVADAVYPASISGIVLRSNGIEINDEYLPQGSIGVPAVIFP